MAIDDMMNFGDLISQEESLQPLTNIIEQIMEMPEENLNNTSIEMMSGMIQGAFTTNIIQEAIDSLIEGLRNDGHTRVTAIETINSLKQGMKEIIEELNPSAMKKQLLENVFKCFYDIFDGVIDRYNSWDIELPMKLDAGAQIPTYAHDSDACADIYAREDTVIPAHSFSNKVSSGLHIALPEGWQARLAPRSSIGSKTPLRMSNSMAIIDTAYTGDIIILYDNLSDSDYTIKAGDRIAQMWVEPVYRFKAKQVDILPATERNSDGLGSTGK